MRHFAQTLYYLKAKLDGYIHVLRRLPHLPPIQNLFTATLQLLYYLQTLIIIYLFIIIIIIVYRYLIKFNYQLRHLQLMPKCFPQKVSNSVFFYPSMYLQGVNKKHCPLLQIVVRKCKIRELGVIKSDTENFCFLNNSISKCVAKFEICTREFFGCAFKICNQI